MDSRPPIGSTFRHVVLFRWNQGITPEILNKISDGLREMRDRIPVVREMVWGENVPANLRNEGFTHCLVVSFNTEADHDIYQAHPQHDAFRALIAPYKEHVTVIDFWTV
ncbi:MAG: hypothetical protein AMXMBFR84_23910 [Candidatus Hydrogenedentota bacterium]